MIGLRTVLAGALLLSAGGDAARAGVVVHFTDGRDLEVRAAQSDGSTVYLEIDGGGELAVPAFRVARLEPVPDPAPVVAAVVTEAGGRGGAPEAWRLAAGAYAELIDRASARYDLDPALLTAMAQVESSFVSTAVSPKGAGGLLQLMPATAARFGVRDVFDPEQNVDGGARYMSWLLERFDGDTQLALAGYNAGEGAVDRHAGVPPYRETKDYVTRVLQGFDRLALR